jgi:SAM-dependent methyltransferase
MEKLKSVVGMTNKSVLYKGVREVMSTTGEYKASDGIRRVDDIKNFIERNNVHGFSGSGIRLRKQMSDLLNEAKKSEEELEYYSMELPPAENAQRTQIIGTLPTYEKAAKMFENQEGALLDFGAGLGEGAKKIGADSYEPFPREGFNPTFSDSTDIPSESYDKVTNLNVLNVVPRDVRDGIVQEIGRVLKPNGTAIITTRGKDVMKATGQKGPEENSIITSRNTYQKGFTQQELKSYIEETLGKGFTVKSIKLGPAGVMVTKAEAFADGGLAEGNLNEEMTPEYDETMDMPVEQPQQEVVVQAEAPQKPTIKMPEKKGKEPVKSEHDQYLDRLAFVESSNNTNAHNKASDALGLYQFVPSTWNNMVDRYMPELKQQKGDFMEFRRNPEVSRFMARKLMEENANILKRKGYKDTKGNLYLAHFAGPSGALKVLRADPNTPVEQVTTEGQRARNPNVFNKVKTAGQLARWAQVKMMLKKKK